MSNDARLNELLKRWQTSHEQGETLSLDQLCCDCPELKLQLEQLVEVQRRTSDLSRLLESRREPGSQEETTPWGAPRQRQAGSLDVERSLPSVPGYEIECELGRGGMGVVYKARQLQLKRVVALKMILGGKLADQEQVARFRIEAEAVARFQHPGIVQIFEIGESEGLPFCALEFVEGGSLDRRINGQPLPPAEVPALAEKLARAVHFAHQRQVIHRDLKPANVLLDAEGSPKITDFGLARNLDDQGQTQSGAIMGTPAYMAPEQAEGKVRELGPAVDIYALGAILYEMLTGRPPFRGPTLMATLELVRNQAPQAPTKLNPGCPRDLETICLKCLDKEPQRRYRSALALAQDLERFQAGEPILARPEGMIRKLGRQLKRQRLPMLVGSIVVVALATVLFFASGMRQTHEAAGLVADIQAGLNASEWTPGHASALDEMIDRLTPLDRGRAEEFRPQVSERYTEAVLAQMTRPRLEPADVVRIQANVAALALRSPTLGEKLQERLTQRLRNWDTVLELSAPFPDWSRAFSEQHVAMRDGRLQTRPQSSPARIVPTEIRCVGNARWEVQFADWESAPEVGIGLNFGRGHTSWAHALAYSHDGRTLASGGADKRVFVWDVGTGLPAQSLQEDGVVLALAFSPDDRRLYVAAETQLAVWDPVTGKRIKVLPAPDGEKVLALALSPDGQTLATAGGLSIRLWKADTLERTGELKGHTGSVAHLAFSGDGTLLVSASADRTARLWDWTRRVAQGFVPTHPAAVEALALSSDGSMLATRTADGWLYLWDLTKNVLSWKRAGLGSGLGFAFSHDRKHLLVHNMLLDVAEQTILGWFKAAPTACAWSNDGRSLAAITWPGYRVQLLDPRSFREQATLSGTGYDFLLSALPGLPVERRGDGKPIPATTFAEARSRAGRFWLQLRRNGAVQFEEPVRVPVGPLTLRAIREGDRLSVQVNDLPPLLRHDPSPLPVQEAVGQLIWPPV